MNKGKIIKFHEKLDKNNNPILACVSPDTAPEIETRYLTIPWYLRGKMGNLEIGTEIIFEIFEDLSGFIFARVDGEWTEELHGDIVIHGSININ